VRYALKIKALVVDDSPTDRHLLQGLLARKLGCKVAAVEDGLEALNKLSTETYHIVLLDMLMPIMNGTEVLLEIRLNPASAELPVVMITGTAEEALIRDVMRLGVTDYIVKPIVTHDVLDRLSDVMRGMQPSSVEEIKPRLDPNRSLVLMVVDQDQHFRHLLSRAIGQTHEVIEVTNGAQALSLALKNRPDAIFLGDNLGAFSRRGVIRKIRELRSLQNLKVFAVTDETDLNAVSSLPYDGIIPKVLVPESLKEHLDRIVFASPAGIQAPSCEPDLQAELTPVA
jgi:CheY-like chemotaxis protein